MESNELFRVLHFSDVQDIESSDKDPVGGVARFKSAINNYRNEKTLVLFSGDAFSPSFLSQIWRGKQMIIPLNSLNIDVACLGNHDLDFQEQQSLELQKQSNFPWVLSNFFQKGTTKRLLQCKQYIIIQKFGFKFGIFGLAQKQWEDTIVDFYHGKLDYIDFVEYGKLMVNRLRVEHNCNFIIALTHMMGYNDTKLAKYVKGIDLILGGHDNAIRSQQINQGVLIKSGANFKHFSVVSIQKQKAACAYHTQQYGVNVKLVNITSEIEPDLFLNDHVLEFTKNIEQQRNKIAFICHSNLDLRFEKIRKQQCPYLRLAAQWYSFTIPCDFAIFNSGNQRNNFLYNKGPIIKKHILNHCKDQIVSKKLSGVQVIQVLQNSVSMYPSLSGRFSSYSGIEFTWDSNKPQGNRIIIQSIKIGKKALNILNKYTVISHHFQSVGGDGFSSLREVKQFEFRSSNVGLYNTDIINKFLDAESAQSQNFSKINSQFYYIQVNQSGQKQIHFNPDKVPINTTML